MAMTGLRFDRVVSDGLVAALAPGGVLAPLVRRVATNEKLDLQLRREAKGRRSWVSVYAGLSSVLDVHERDGRFRFRAHATYRNLSPFDHWDTWLTADAVANAASAVAQYLDVILGEPIV